MSLALASTKQPDYGCLFKKINTLKDVSQFKISQAYKNIVTFVDLLCEHIQGTGNKVFNQKYALEHEVFKKCSELIDELEKRCEQTDLNLAQSAGTLRFGHVAFREWFDDMKRTCKEFIDELVTLQDDNLKAELLTYLTESFGNRMRIDYGTGHELNFIIFTMGLSYLVDQVGGDSNLNQTKLKAFVTHHGWDIHSLFAQKYLRLVRKVQTKFRLEPAGSRGVYNMDDFQFLPFLFGAAQLSGIKYIPANDFYNPDQVDMFKSDFIFLEAVDFILNNKRGPFNEHSYTLWNFSNLGSWEKLFRRIRVKFTDDILEPFPIIQHFLFGKYILRWDHEQKDSSS